ncbi:MAG: phage portal protein [Parasporobacterium sp.]|nr:phage portal protein [Parasporobacterium sp.]
MADDLKGIAYLRRKLNTKRDRVNLRYKHYEMKHITKDLNVSTPKELKWLNEVLGWCAMAVDSLADRIVFREFRDDNLGMNEIFQMNNIDILPDSAVLSALISSCSFIYISPDENGFPRMQVIDGGNATGEIDPITGLLKEGYAVLKRDSDSDAPLIEAYFTPDRTDYYEPGKAPRSIGNPAGIPLLVPVIFRPDARRPFGHSRISRSCMSLVDGAVRTLKRSEITAEFYSFPQKWVTGLSQDAEAMDKWKATISSMLVFTKDSNEQHPVVGQFAQQSIQPHIDQLRMFASAFAGETGLTLDDLGFPQDNPSSADAIKAAHENMRLRARKAQRTFGSGFLNAGYVAACLRDQYPYRREVMYLTTPVFEPIFEPDAAMLAGIGDAVVKINQAIPDYVTGEKMRDMTGY